MFVQCVWPAYLRQHSWLPSLRSRDKIRDWRFLKNSSATFDHLTTGYQIFVDLLLLTNRNTIINVTRHLILMLWWAVVRYWKCWVAFCKKVRVLYAAPCDTWRVSPVETLAWRVRTLTSRVKLPCQWSSLLILKKRALLPVILLRIECGLALN